MAFEQRFPVTRQLIPICARRPGLKMTPKVRFLVAHDTANPGATARDHLRFYLGSPNPPPNQVSSAQIFVDDQEIIELIPALSDPEQARHVLYSVPTDNTLYGVDANRAAIGIELCYGNHIDPTQAYNRYVWLLAYLCSLYDLDPSRDVVGHQMLDPARRSDPGSALEVSGRSYAGLLADIVTTYRACSGAPANIGAHHIVKGAARTTVSLRRRENPDLSAAIRATLSPGVSVDVAEIVTGTLVSGNSDWARLADGGFCWTGGLTQEGLATATPAATPAPSPTPAPAPAPAPASGFAARAVAVAIGEWHFFGDNTQGLTGATTKRGHKETDAATEPGKEAWFARVGDYWLEGTGTHGLDGKDTDTPWSATFISYVMRKAGAGTRFRYSTLHATYISQGIRDLASQRADAGYWCYRLPDRKPKVGDLVCWSRQAGIDYDHQKGGSYKGHCDVVVAVNSGSIDIIGGNVGNSVTRRPLALAADGTVAPVTRGGETLFGLMACRIP